MKRDLDLMRDILRAVEESDHDPSDWIELNFPERGQRDISYNVKQLAMEGLIEAADHTDKDEFAWYPKSLTPTGHKFLEAARDNTIWARVMKALGKDAKTVSLAVLTAMLTAALNPFK